MTDNEIMKAVECCQSQRGCKDCPYDGKCCSDDFLKNHLFTDRDDLTEYYTKKLEIAKSEAIKEFGAIWHKRIDKVRSKLIAEPPLVKTAFEIVIDVTDNLAKEMTEGKEC